MEIHKELLRVMTPDQGQLEIALLTHQGANMVPCLSGLVPSHKELSSGNRTSTVMRVGIWRNAQ